MNDQKPYLSATQIDMFCRCGEAWRRRYVEGEVIPPGVAAIKGKGLHRAAEVNMRQKLESRKDLPVAEIRDLAIAEFETQLAGGVAFQADESPIKAIGEAKDSLVDIATAHAEMQAPDYQPAVIEQTVRIELPGKYDLLGIVDLIDDQQRVVDWKTAGRAKSERDAHESTQLTVYAVSMQALTGNLPSECRLDVLVAGKRETKRQIVSTTRSQADVVVLAEKIQAVSAAIEAGVFLPAAPGSWSCSAEWCGYYSTCRFVRHR